MSRPIALSRIGQVGALGLLAGVAAVLFGTGARAAEPPTVRNELPVPAGMDNAQAMGINDAGLIVGWAQGPTANGTLPQACSCVKPHAMVWTASASGGTMLGQELPDLDGAVGVAAAESEALGLNQAGAIVGWSDSSVASPHQAVVWMPRAPGVYGAPIHLITGFATDPALGHQPGSAALAINIAGQIVGWADDQTTTSEPSTRAVLWTPVPGNAYAVTDLGPVIARNGGSLGTGKATAINDLGQIAGEIQDTAVVWMPSPVGATAGADTLGAPDLTYVPLPLDASTATAPTDPSQIGSPSTGKVASSHAFGINNAGHIVGSSGDRAVVWSRPGPGLPYTEAALPALGIGNQALAINEAGQIAGLVRYGGLLAGYVDGPGTRTTGDGGPGTSLPVVWTPSPSGGAYGTPALAGTDQDLPYGEARAINKGGQMVGDVHPLYANRNTNNVLLDYHAALWMPPAGPGSGASASSNGMDGGWEGGGPYSAWSRHHRHHFMMPPLARAATPPTPIPNTSAAKGSPPGAAATGTPPGANAPILANLIAGNSAHDRRSRVATGEPTPDALADDAFLATLSALVLVPTGLIVLGWFSWERGWTGAAWRQLSNLRGRPRRAASAW